MKKITTLVFLTLFFLFSGLVLLNAQTEKSEFEKMKEEFDKDFQNFKDEQKKVFEDFRAQVNAAFAEILSKTWEEFWAQEAIPAPKAPEPAEQPVAEPKAEITNDPVPVQKITPLPAVLPPPKPVSPIVPVSEPEPEKQPTLEAPQTPKNDILEPPKNRFSDKSFSFLFFNTDCQVSLDDALRFRLPDISEQSVSDAWRNLSGNKYNALLMDCLELRDQMNLSDWGYWQLLKTISEKFLGKGTNESVLLQMFILTQSGYKVRIARSGGQLALLIPFKETIFEYVYLTIGGIKYYVVNKELTGSKFGICNHEFPKEQFFSWQTGLPKLAEKLNPPKMFASKAIPDINVSIQTNQNLIDFYNCYPLSSRWDLYVSTGFSETVKKSFYPVLKKAIAGKSKTEAAEIILRYLQTSFDYQTDDQQFGYERPFFADENFFYPYNNCKDRAILYCILVNDLLGLEAVLLEYPAHLATAVHFPESVPGDYLMDGSKKFTVCDPTYIGASIGMTMPNLKNVPVEIVKLKP